MSFKKIKEYMPEFYYPFLPEIFDKEIPAESFTDCANCPMTCSSTEELGTDMGRPFSPATKCCTFIPYLPNYLVGALLTDPDPSLNEGKKRLKASISSRRGIFPQGVFPTKKYTVLYDMGKAQGFGKSLTLKCPYFVPGKYNCTLWKYREAVCSTWFCKHISQNAGRTFWEQITSALRLIEESLTLFVLNHTGLDTSNPYGDNGSITFEDLDDMPMAGDEYTRKWGRWEGREEEFYAEANKLVSGLTPQAFQDITGIRLTIILNGINTAHAEMMSIPEFLRPNTASIFPGSSPDKYRMEISTWIERSNTHVTHSFELPAVIIDSFDGQKSTDEVLKHLKQKHRIDTGKEILIALYRHNILEEAKSLY